MQPTVEVLMDDSFYPGLHGALYPCIVHEIRPGDNQHICEIYQDADRINFAVPAKFVYPLRPREPERLDWQPGQHVEVRMRLFDLTEPEGYWPAVVLERVEPYKVLLRWSGRYNDGTQPIFPMESLRSRTSFESHHLVTENLVL